MPLRFGPFEIAGTSRRLALLLPVLLLAGGCGGDKRPPRAAVSGRVTLDGQEIEQGSIAFKAIGANEGLAAGGAIQYGRYAVEKHRGPVVGRNRVEIRCVRKTGRQVQAPMSDPGVMTDETAEGLPARYNAQSTLEREVKSGDNQFDFELTTK